MSSLKEIKTRIGSVRSTLQITSAMKMVAAAKLHRAQQGIAGMLPYEEKLHGILSHLLSSEEVAGNIGGMHLLAEKGFDIHSMPDASGSGKVALVAFSSNSSLCGGFNSNALKNLSLYRQRLLDSGIPGERIEVYTIGKRISDSARKLGMNPITHLGATDLFRLADKPRYEDAAAFSAALVERFRQHDVKQAVLLYNHYASNASQPPVAENFLPLCMEPASSASGEELLKDLIVEPDAASLVKELLPKVLSLKIYSVMLDANAAEHAARTVAMQIATDNAKKLLEELTLAYNKSRQQKITNEILDLAGGMRQ